MENLKIFIYNNNGKIITEKDFALPVLEEIVKNINTFNTNNVNDIQRLYIGPSFPPNDCVWDDSEKNWKNADGQILKIFIYDDNGEKTKEGLCSNFLNTFSEKDSYFNSLIDFEFPPKDYEFNKELKKWFIVEKIPVIDEEPIETPLVGEILKENIIEESNDNDVLKVFVYNTKGEKIKEELYSLFVEAYDFVLNHNSKSPNDPYNIYPGTTFPPKGYKWSEKIGDWIELTKFEKWQKKEIDIPNDCFVVDNIIVRKSLSILNKEGLYKILPTQKIDEEYNIVIDKTKQELLDEGLANWEEIYQNYYKIFKKKLDDYLDVIYFKYPKSVVFQFSYKADLAVQWKNLSQEKKEEAKVLNFNQFVLLISEFKDINKNYTLDEIVIELDIISDKILQKKYEIDSKLGLVNNFFNSLNNEILAIKEEKNFLKLFDFVAGVENKISQWIKS